MISKATPVQVSLQKSLLDESVVSVPTVVKMQADKALKECNGILEMARSSLASEDPPDWQGSFSESFPAKVNMWADAAGLLSTQLCATKRAVK